MQTSIIATSIDSISCGKEHSTEYQGKKNSFKVIRPQSWLQTMFYMQQTPKQKNAFLESHVGHHTHGEWSSQQHKRSCVPDNPSVSEHPATPGCLAY